MNTKEIRKQIIKELRDEVIEEVANYVATFDGRVHPLDIADKIREELKNDSATQSKGVK